MLDVFFIDVLDVSDCFNCWSNELIFSTETFKFQISTKLSHVNFLFILYCMKTKKKLFLFNCKEEATNVGNSKWRIAISLRNNNNNIAKKKRYHKKITKKSFYWLNEFMFLLLQWYLNLSLWFVFVCCWCCLLMGTCGIFSSFHFV